MTNEGFIDARGMWQGRGRGAFTALGEVRFLGKSNPLYGAGTATNEFRGRGYSIEESSGIPRFNYTHGTINVTDMIAPLPGNNGVQHKVNLSQRGNGLTYRLVTADSIARQENGSFLIDGGRFVIGAISGGTVNIRDSGTSLELAVEESDLSYTVSW